MESSKSILPVEICAQIAQHARMSDLPALARVSKPLQVLAETRLYQHIVMRDPPSVYRISISLLARDHQRALYVKRLWVYQDHRASRSPWPEDLWDVVRKVLNALHNLESAYLYDESSTNTWLFDPARIPFQLREANLGFHWDDALMSFLEGQKDLQVLTLQMPEDDEITHRTLSRDALPKVELFDGPLFVALDLRFRPLRRLNIRVDEETVPLFSIYLAELALVNRTLRSLNVQNVPEYLVADSLRVLASSPLAESMRYLGILNLPAAEVRCHHLWSR
ncbi:hypothetical protein BDW22DRAFT_1352978 [Trametopsis cervina]|nr:hypothetical protein BDW22DRAFT_1352978 [Trametopsis cervina]